MVEVRVLDVELQVQQSYVEIGIDAQVGIVTDLYLVLDAELSRSGTEYLSVIACEIPQIDTDLCV